MLKECDSLNIPIRSQFGEMHLMIVGASAKDKLYLETSPYPGEAAFQLQEGCNYQYEFESIDNRIFQFKEESDIIKYSSFRAHHNMGNIKTGIYVGQLHLPVCDDASKQEVGKVRLEIRSVKSDYETDYRMMLDEIAEYYTELVLLQGSPVKQQLEVDENSTPQTLYQKFSFVRSIVDSEAFQEAIHKIMSNPERKWTETVVRRNIVGVRHFSRRNMREMATAHDRIPFNDNRQGMPVCLTSVPRRLDVAYKRDTVDNQENQFVKFALRTFSMFCCDLKDKKNASGRLRDEADRTINQIASYLDSQFFRQISMPTHLNMNSPVLQRKEGYREVLQAWLMFDLAAKLNWTGGDNVYEAGKKNVATLYEYWLFFKLQELIGEFFQLDLKDKAKLVKFDSDKIDLDIIQGKKKVLGGKSKSDLRELNVAFYYNRTFSKPSGDVDAIHTAGSWTMSMRPDYTLSIWPGEITEDEAESQDLITHIHFDAKYRLNKIVLEDEPSENTSKELDEEKKQQELGVYKRADLLKMHAYKDAIRRTSGAYVLYPGTENREIKGFHEIIPGLGAFCIRPGHWMTDSQYLRQFLSEVKAHMLDRTSEREKLSYFQYDVYKEENSQVVMEKLPEPVNGNRDFLPDETSVIVAYYKDQTQLDWILGNHLYNMRAGDDKGSIPLENKLLNARYLLLHDGVKSTHFIKIIKLGPKVYTRSQLLNLGYPRYEKKIVKADGTVIFKTDEEREQKEANRIYLVFSLYKSNETEKEFKKYVWYTKDILRGQMVAKPTPMKLSQLIKKAKNR